MRRRAAIRNLVVAGAASCFSRLLRPQEFVLRSEVRLVLLDVSVKDRQGGFVPDLQREHFQVLEDGKPQIITVFSGEDVPATVGILVDESGSMSGKRNEVLSAAGGFIQTSNPKDEIFVLNFNDSVNRGLPDETMFSDDIAQLRTALYRGVPRGRTALNDAVVQGLQHLELGHQERKALLLISDGGDNASRRTNAEMLAQVESRVATIYAIGLFDADDPDRNPRVLRRLADVSGGEAFFPETPAGMTGVCQRIAREIRTRYTIGYLPPAGDHNALRHIQVRVAAPGRSGLTARSRTRYRYEELPNAGGL